MNEGSYTMNISFYISDERLDELLQIIENFYDENREFDIHNLMTHAEKNSFDEKSAKLAAQIIDVCTQAEQEAEEEIAYKEEARDMYFSQKLEAIDE